MQGYSSVKLKFFSLILHFLSAHRENWSFCLAIAGIRSSMRRLLGVNNDHRGIRIFDRDGLFFAVRPADREFHRPGLCTQTEMRDRLMGREDATASPDLAQLGP